MVYLPPQLTKITKYKVQTTMLFVLPVTPSCHASYKQDHPVRVLPLCKVRELKLALPERWRNPRLIATRLIIHIWKYISVLNVFGISVSTPGFNASWSGCAWLMCEIKNGRNLPLTFSHGTSFARALYEKISLIWSELSVKRSTSASVILKFLRCIEYAIIISGQN